MPGATNQRAHERWPVQLAAEVLVDGSGASGQIQNLSLGGAFLACSTSLPMGSGLRLSFRLPNGMPVSATGRVVRVQTKPSETTPAGIGIEFYGLDDVTQEILQSYFASTGQRGETTQGDGRFEEKFRVETDNKERVYLLLSGFLDKRECENLARTMSKTLAALTGTGIRLCINATQYQCCAPESVDHFKKCFALLTKRSWLAAALVGPKSVGMMQMPRAARDANVADSFASFEDVNEALEFLEMVQS